MTRILCLLLVSLTSCATSPSSDAKSTRSGHQSGGLPAWVHDFEAPDDSLYAVGSGPNLEVATRSALAEVAAGLSVSVSSETHIRATQIGDRSTEQLRQRIDARVQDTKFRAWRKVKSEDMDGVYYALVRVDRDQLIRDVRGELDSLNATLEHRLDPDPPLSALRFWATYRDSLDGLDRAVVLNMLLSGLDESFDGISGRLQLSTWQDRYELALAGMEFGVASTLRMREVAGIAEDLLTDAQLPVRSGGGCANGTGACIEVKGRITTRQVGNTFIARIDSSWELHDDSGQLISVTPHRYAGNSRLGALEAEQDAHRKMRAALESVGIGRALGL